MASESNDNNLSQEIESLLKEQIQQQQLVIDIAQRIRQSLDIDEVLRVSVHEIRTSLMADRVFLYRFAADYSGTVVVESIDPNWRPIIDTQVQDSYFVQTRGEDYKQGRYQAVADIYTSNLSQCHRDLLIQFQVRAILVVPVLQTENLWGLLIVNQCGVPREWKLWEINLLKQLATQVGIAIQQSELHEQLQAELIEIRQAEQEIRQQAALLDITTDGIIVFDLEAQISFWNRGAERLYGFSITEVIGQKLQMLLCPETLPQFEEAKTNVIKGGSWQGELRKLTKFGKEIIVSSRWTLMSNQETKGISILTVNTDITEKKQLEVQILRAQRLETLGRLASGIAHDLNNILTPILATSELLAVKFSHLDSPYNTILKILEQNAIRGAELVKQILVFARGTEGKRTYLQLEPLLLEIEQVTRSTFPKSIKICKHLPSEKLWKILVEPTNIHQILMNLCLNARDAMLQGGTLSIKAENFLVDESFTKMELSAKVGPYLLITIQDTGIGIPAAIIERIFEPFFTTKELSKGTGLGLATVIGIVKNYGGFVKVNSEVGKGTKFQVYLPSIQAEAIQQAENLELPIGNRELILAVDDEIAILEISKTLLEDSNYRTLTARNGIEALSLYVQFKNEINIVLMNMMMPSMDGLTAIKILREINPQVKIVAVSGISTEQEIAEVIDSGVNAFLRKPYTFSQLLNIIRDILRESV